MRRRLLPAALLALTVLTVPTAASAAPSDPPVTETRFSSDSAWAQVPLPDGRVADVSVSRYRASESDEWQGSLFVSLQTPCTGWSCASAYGSVALTGEQVSFDSRLQQASVTDVPMVLSSRALGVSGHTEVTVSLTVTSTGAPVRDVSHGEQCGDGSTPCLNSVRRDVTRSADVELRLGELTGVGSGTMSRGSSVDVYRTPTGG
ncbi:hypothetical protein SAMN05660690_3156 [Geodermatophilus telluris]|uniref:Neocarzinostatin family protein n=1 Tax=Geodermatophilus telluris TaxID=1190417 RepID=A0A1G6QZI7_9ACTN|nr:hypothetical protein [Geodermatophilus telluris]SDC97404.1 hypothetical protein SAMN05660690_3156 [Geodermatophilus telluris]